MDPQATVTEQQIRSLVPFAEFLDVTFSEIRPDRVVAHLPRSSRYGTIGGGVHGGAQMALGDIVAAVVAVIATGDPAAVPSTVQSSTNFLRPAQGALRAEASVVRGGRTSVIDVVVLDETAAIVSTVRQVIAVRTAGGDRR